jgi:hypothetical protein
MLVKEAGSPTHTPNERSHFIINNYCRFELVMPSVVAQKMQINFSIFKAIETKIRLILNFYNYYLNYEAI